MKTTAEAINNKLGAFAIGRGYDAVSNLTEIKAGADGTTALGYNTRYDLVGIDVPGGETTEVIFGYDGAKRKTGATQPGVASVFAYDEASRIKSVVNETFEGSIGYDYEYDSNGNITAQTSQEGLGQPSETRYGYDALNRLKAWYNPLTDTTTTYSYDKVGNLLEVKEGEAVTKSFAYNTANQISSLGYTYDANGNMVEDPERHYVYDAENRLKTVASKATSQTIAGYAYDFMGRRISSTDASGSTTYFHYDGWNVVAESDSSGAITANYYYDTKGQIQAMKRADQMYYYQFNAHGDVVSLTDASGTIVNSYSYDPWGNHLTTSETVSNPYRYAGYRWDEGTGLYYLRARYYAPGIGRFLTKDLFKGAQWNPKSLNEYVYTKDNPVKRTDPSGLIDLFIGVEADLTGILGIEVGAGIVIDTDQLSDSGIYGSAGMSAGASVGVAGQAGVAVRDIEGTALNFDINAAGYSGVVTFDKKGFNAVAAGVGPGVGLTSSGTITGTYSVAEGAQDLKNLWKKLNLYVEEVL